MPCESYQKKVEQLDKRMQSLQKQWEHYSSPGYVGDPPEEMIKKIKQKLDDCKVEFDKARRDLEECLKKSRGEKGKANSSGDQSTEQSGSSESSSGSASQEEKDRFEDYKMYQSTSDAINHLTKYLYTRMPGGGKQPMADLMDYKIFTGMGGGLNDLVLVPGKPIYIVYGNRSKKGAGTFMHTVHILNDVHITSVEKSVSPDGTFIIEKMNFVARSLDHPETEGETIQNSDIAGRLDQIIGD